MTNKSMQAGRLAGWRAQSHIESWKGSTNAHTEEETQCAHCHSADKQAQLKSINCSKSLKFSQVLYDNNFENRIAIYSQNSFIVDILECSLCYAI